MKTKWSMCLFVCCMVFVDTSVAAVRYTITDLGTLGGWESGATDINNRGQVVGWSEVFGSYSHDSLDIYGFLWQDGVMINLGTRSCPTAINDVGQVVGGSWVTTWWEDEHVFLWENGVMRDLGIPGRACDINNLSQVVGDSYLWENGVVTNFNDLVLSVPPEFSSGDRYSPRGINDAGQIVGGVLPPGCDMFRSGFLWTDGTVTRIPGVTWLTYSNKINNAGQVIGHGQTSRGSEAAYIWQEGVTIDLIGLSGYIRNRDINNLGQVVGASREFHAFLWENGIMTDLNELIPVNSGWQLWDANGINDAGQIVGEGATQDGYGYSRRGFLLTPWPGDLRSKKQTGTLVVPWPWRTTKTTYELGFTDRELRIDLDIRLTGANPGVELIQRWEEGIEKMWSNQYDVIDDNRRYPIVLDVEFVDLDEDVTVRVVEGDGRDDMVTWYTGDPAGWGSEYQDEVAAHEVGHMLGLYDEYPETFGGVLDPANPIIDYTSIMGSLDGTPKERHFEHFLSWLEGEAGWDMVLGQSPLYQPGELGNPVGDGPPIVPEPGTLILLGSGGLLLIRYRVRRKRR